MSLCGRFVNKCDVIESLYLEITNEKSRNVILTLTYKPPNGTVIEKNLKNT